MSLAPLQVHYVNITFFRFSFPIHLPVTASSESRVKYDDGV